MDDMFFGLDSSIRECEFDQALDEWYDVVINNAVSYLDAFTGDDWEKLFQVLPHKSDNWKRRLCDCLYDGKNQNHIKALHCLKKADDPELLKMVDEQLKRFGVMDQNG